MKKSLLMMAAVPAIALGAGYGIGIAMAPGKAEAHAAAPAAAHEEEAAAKAAAPAEAAKAPKPGKMQDQKPTAAKEAAGAKPAAPKQAAAAPAKTKPAKAASKTAKASEKTAKPAQPMKPAANQAEQRAGDEVLVQMEGHVPGQKLRGVGLVPLGRVVVPVFKARSVTYVVADFAISVPDPKMAEQYRIGENAARLRDAILAEMYAAAGDKSLAGPAIDSDKLSQRIKNGLTPRFSGVEDVLFISLFKRDVPLT